MRCCFGKSIFHKYIKFYTLPVKCYISEMPFSDHVLYRIYIPLYQSSTESCFMWSCLCLKVFANVDIDLYADVQI